MVAIKFPPKAGLVIHKDLSSAISNFVQSAVNPVTILEDTDIYPYLVTVSPRLEGYAYELIYLD